MSPITARNIQRLRFLIHQYSQWVISMAPGESVLLDSKQIKLERRAPPYRLRIDHSSLAFKKTILSIRTEKGGRCILRLQGRSLSAEEVVLLSPREAERLGRETTLRRDAFQKKVVGLLLEMLPGAKIRRRRTSTNPRRSPFGSFLFLDLLRGKSRKAIVAVEPEIEHRRVHSILSSGLIWHHSLRKRMTPGLNLSLTLLLPRFLHEDLLRLLNHVDPKRLKYELFQDAGKQLTRSFSGSLRPGLAHRSTRAIWPRPGPYVTSPLVECVFQRFPGKVRRFPRAGGGSSFRVHGLEVLRSLSKAEDPVYFGPPDFCHELREKTWPDFLRLMEDVLTIRRYDSEERNHPYYRWQTERWLEEVILCEPGNLDPSLDRRFVYSQVPAYHGDQRVLVDLLSVTPHGRLVVIELKVDRDPELLLQALDYWDRVHRHNLENEFERRGYFADMKLSKEKPLLYLVVPVFAFDRRIGDQREYLDGSLEIYRILVGGNWRRKLRVVRKERLGKRVGWTSPNRR